MAVSLLLGAASSLALLAPAGVALGSAHFNAWRQAAAEYSYSEAMGLAPGLHASAPEALVAVRGGGATPSLRTSGIGPAPLAVREAAVRRVVLDPAPERSAAAAVAATAPIATATSHSVMQFTIIK